MKISLLALLVMLCSMLSVNAEEQKKTVRSFRDLVAEWVELRKQTAREKADWKEEQAALTRESKLLSRERGELEKKKQVQKEKNREKKSEYAKQADELEKHEQKLQAFETLVSDAEVRLKKWKNRIPASVSGDSLKRLFDKLENSTDIPLSGRLQNVFSICTEISHLQHSVHVTREVIETDKEEREYDVIYLGMCTAFCVSDNGEMAGIGSPDEQGWSWKWDSSIAARVRSAIECFRQEKKADFITVPLKIGNRI